MAPRLSASFPLSRFVWWVLAYDWLLFLIFIVPRLICIMAVISGPVFLGCHITTHGVESHILFICFRLLLFPDDAHVRLQ